MWITSYSDASFHQKTGGAWAVWLRSGAGRAVPRGACPMYVRDGNAAELAAILRGRLPLHFKWVKGHQRVNASTSAWRNNQVDRLARSTRRAARSTS